jgi:hypothetical protein
MTTNAMWTRQLLRAAVLVAAAAVTGCTTSKQEKPALAGPSEFGQSITVTVDRDRIPQDGVSRANVVATIYGADGKPITSERRVTVQWQVSATTGAFVEPSVQQSDTDGEGKARMFVTAPAPPAVLPTGNARLVVTARVVGSDFLSTLNLRTVEVQLIPPAGTLPPNRLPVASFTVVPAIGNINQEITFDASDTTDEGEPCGSLCTYQWDFGNFETDSGQRVTKTFGRSGTFTITLTVTDPRGGVDSDARSLKINGPPPPTAGFGSTTSGLTVALNAAPSLAGAGGTLVEYIWDFGDGTSQTTTLPAVSHAYPSVGASGTVTPYVVVLTVKDNFGQTAITSSTVSVTTP